MTLSIAELSARALDGELVRLGDGYAPYWQVQSARDRARSLDLRQIEGTTLSLWIAAWIHGCSLFPESIDVSHPRQLAGCRPTDPRVVVRRRDLSLAADTVVVGGRRVTTRAVTAMHLLAEVGASALATVHELCPDTAALRAFLQSRPSRQQAAARQALAVLEGVER